MLTRYVHSSVVAYGFLLVFVVTCLVLNQQNAFATEVNIELSNVPLSQRDKISAWVNHGVTAVEAELGGIPRGEIAVELVIKPNASEPVPFAQVIRGPINTIKLQVNTAWPLQDFVDDWTLYHELSHLYIPYLDYPSFWLNEGFATYMQNVVMLGGQVIDKNVFIDKMQAGFERGRINTVTEPGKLSMVSDDMWRKRAYMRVYWSGAAFFTELDAELIKQQRSLTQIMAQYRLCCLTAKDSGEALMRQLDQIAGVNIFSSMFIRYADRTDFPQLPKSTLAIIAAHYSQKNP